MGIGHIDIRELRKLKKLNKIETNLIDGKKILEDRVAIITGGSSPIGRSIVRKLHNNGAKIVFTYYKNKDVADKLVSELKANIFSIKCDNKVDEDIKNVVDFTLSKFGKIDILINNAGSGWQGGIERFDRKTFLNYISVDVAGAMEFCKYIVPTMKQRRYGKIINISSIVSISGINGHSLHGAVKAALTGFTKNLSIELSSFNINVNSISPGTIRSHFPEYVYEHQKNRNIPLRRVGEPEDISNVVLFLSSDLSSFILGQNIVVDGGQTLIVRYD